jgi:hypothetical protein
MNIKKELLLEKVNEDMLDIEYLREQLLKGLVLTIPRRFLINEEGQKKKDYNKRK